MNFLTALIPALILFSACDKSGPYEPCTTVDQCDAKKTDACVKPTRGKTGYCTLVCQTAKTCPATPSGAGPVCETHYGVGLCADPGENK